MGHYWCFTGAILKYYWYTTGALAGSAGVLMAIIRLLLGATGYNWILFVYYYCIIGILPVYYWCTIGVLPLCVCALLCTIR